MKGPRSWNRREFDVTPAGFFTVLKPSGWFSATSRLPAGFRDAPFSPHPSADEQPLQCRIERPFAHLEGILRQSPDVQRNAISMIRPAAQSLQNEHVQRAFEEFPIATHRSSIYRTEHEKFR